VENFPGFPKGVQGPDLMIAMKEQAEQIGTRVVSELIATADLSRRPFKLTDTAGGTVEAETIVIASGATANYLGLPSEEKFKGHGVSACAVCDGALPRFRGKPIVVVGGGDSACEEANFLSKFASQVHLVYRKGREEMRASPVMIDRTMNNPKIRPVFHHVVDEVLGVAEHGLSGVRVKHVKTGETQTIDAAGMFVAIGHTPNTKFLKGQLQLDPQGFIKLVDPARTLTSVEGVFAAGDVADPLYKQAITAAAMGCKAALDAERFLEAVETHNPNPPMRSQWE
jgi:thioredoxin reductase (NADPH)